MRQSGAPAPKGQAHEPTRRREPPEPFAADYAYNTALRGTAGLRAAADQPNSSAPGALLQRVPQQQQVELLLAYQRSAGNTYVQRMLGQRRASRRPTRDEKAQLDLFEPQVATSEPHSGALQRASTRNDSDGGIVGSIRKSVDGIVNGLRSGWDGLRGSVESAINGLEKRAAGVEAALGKAADGALHAIAGGWASLKNTANALTRELETRLQGGSVRSTAGQAHWRMP